MVADRVTSYIFRGNFTNLGAGLTTMAKGVGDLGVKLTALDKQGATSRRGLTQLGGTAGKIGLVAAAGVGVLIASAANFDQAMSRVQAATGASTDGLEELRSAAIKAGAATVFSASEAADAITAMSKAGVSANDILSGGLDGALALASAGELDVAQAADIAATAMNQFGLAGKDIPHIADLLAAGAASAQGEVTDFATALKYVGPVAHQMGISIEETTGVIAELASQGVLADQAGTSLRGMLTALTSPSVMAKKQMQQLGISLYDASGQFVGFDGVAEQLHTTLGGLTNAERDQALGRIFGNEQITAARILYAGGADAVAKWTDAVDKDGAAADIAATKLNNLKGDLEQLRGSLETAFIGAGGGAQGPLRSLVQGATAAVNAFNELPGPVKSSVTALGGLTAITGGSFWFGSKVIRGVADTKQALKDMGVEAGRASAAIKGIGLAAGGLAVLATVGTLIDQLQKKFDRAVPGVEALTKSLLDLDNAQTAAALKDQIGDLGDALGEVDADGLKGLNQDFLELQESGGALGNTIKGLEALGSFGGSLFTDSGGDLREAKASIDAVDEALTNIVTTGSADQAREIFDQLAAAQGLSADEQKTLLALLPQYNEALAGAANTAALTSTATDGLATSDTSLGDAATDTAQQIADLVKSMQDQKDAAVSAFDAITGYRQAMKDAAKQAKESNAGIAGSSDEALKNRGALSGLIGAWNSLDQTVTDNVGKFKAARDNFVKTAEGMHVSRDAALKLWQEMAKIPSSKVIPVSTPGVEGAIRLVGNLRNELGQLKDKTIHITTVHVGGHTSSTVEPHAQITERRAGRSAAGLDLVSPRTSDLASASNSYALHALSDLGKQSDDAGKAAKGLKERLHDAEQKLDRMSRAADSAHDALDSLKSQRDDLSSSVSGSLEHDPFAIKDTAPINPWSAGSAGGGLAAFNNQVASDTADAQAVLAALQTLVTNGLDPHSALFKRLAASGNVSLIQEFASLTRDQLAGEIAQFGAGQTALTSVGAFAGNSAFGDLIKAQSKVTNHLDATVHDLAQQVNKLEKAVKDLPDKVKQGSKEGTKEGTTEGTRQGVQATFTTVTAATVKGKNNQVFGSKGPR